MQPIEVSRIVMREVLDVQEGEEVLIITNPGEVLGISLSLFEAAKEFKAKPTIVVQEPKESLDYAERVVIEAIKSEPDIVISISEKKLLAETTRNILTYLKNFFGEIKGYAPSGALELTCICI